MRNEEKTSSKEEDDLLNELGPVLEDLQDQTCAEMVPLWLLATLHIRQEEFSRNDPEWEDRYPKEKRPLSDLLTPRYRALSKGVRSRYKYLACWRYAVLWLKLEAEAPDFDRALRALYFTPYPDNTPPYAWSRSAGRAPNAKAFDSPSTLKNWAKEGAWSTIKQLKELCKTNDPSGLTYLRKKFLRQASQRTLRDALKLEDHWSK